MRKANSYNKVIIKKKTNSHSSFECFPAHTKESANAFVKTIKMPFGEAPLALLVAMASDKIWLYIIIFY